MTSSSRTDTESHDDVAGLFKRLDRDSTASHYHTFEQMRPLPGAKAVAPAAVTAPPEAPVAKVVGAAASGAEHAKAVVAAALASAGTAAPAAQTELARLFQRLADAPVTIAPQVPLEHLSGR